MVRSDCQSRYIVLVRRFVVGAGIPAKSLGVPVNNSDTSWLVVCPHGRAGLFFHACCASKKMRVAHDAATGMSIVPDLSPEPQLEIRKGSAPQTPDPGPGPLTPLILQNFSCNSASEAEGSAAPFIVPGGSTAFYAGGNCDRSESTNLLSIKGLCAGPSWP